MGIGKKEVDYINKFLKERLKSDSIYMGYSIELFRAAFTKIISSLLPQKGKHRIIKSLYNYQSKNIRGIDICVPYLKNYQLKFLVNTKDIIGWKIFFFGEYEESTNQLLKKIIMPGHCVIEAGANNGSETLLLSKLVENGKIYAFEPVPHIFNRLKFNVDINKLNHNIHLFEIALGEDAKEVVFNIFPESYANQGMSSKYGGNTITSQIKVSQTTLDIWAETQNISRMDFIKMDIQGAELDLLKGAKVSLEKFKPIIFTEAAEGWLNIEELYLLLININYRVYFIDGEKLFLMESVKQIKKGNWLAIHHNKEIPF